MTLRELLGLIGASKAEHAEGSKLADALHDSEGNDAPVLVRLFSAIGTWIGALMIAVIFIALEIYETAPVALVLGAALFVGAFVLARRPRRSLVITQLIWAMAVGAQALVLGVLAEQNAEEPTLALVWTGINVASMLLIWVPSFALISAVLAVGSATWFAMELELPMFPLWVALPVAGVATAAWILEVRWAKRLGPTWTALAYGLPLGVAGPLALIGAGHEGSGLVAHGWGATLSTVVIVGLIAVVLIRANQELGAGIDRRAYLLGALAVVACLAARHVPGLALALLWLLVAQLRKSGGLRILALIQLGGFLLFFYYQLETSLLLKSLSVISTGAVLVASAYFLRAPSPSPSPVVVEKRRRSRWLPAIVLVALTSGLMTVAVVQKQRVIADGRSVLLPLAPVDPRSLMQGDYMVLRYALEQEVDEGFGYHSGLERHGRLVIALDSEGVGHFVRRDDGGVLAENELRLEYRIRDGFGGWLRVGAESFLFEEGSGELYAGARFGELVVSEDGEAVLIGLRDEHRQPLGQRMHDR